MHPSADYKSSGWPEVVVETRGPTSSLPSPGYFSQPRAEGGVLYAGAVLGRRSSHAVHRLRSRYPARRYLMHHLLSESKPARYNL